MPTAREYFERKRHLEIGGEFAATSKDDGQLLVDFRLVLAFTEGAKYIRLYIPQCTYPDMLLNGILENTDRILNIDQDLSIQMGLKDSGEDIPSTDLFFTGRVIVYTPTKIERNRWERLIEHWSYNGIRLLIRDEIYVQLKDKYEEPRAFISHDSRDKDLLVRELASKLASSLCPVWYDEYSLVPGTSLRESIEDGLKKCPKCVIVLSKNFFSNPGWSKREFDVIYTREVLQGGRIMIPIWLDVTREEVYNYSPILLDTLGISAELGIDEVARKLMAALNYDPPSESDPNDVSFTRKPKFQF